ncbi:cation:proton antiporter [Aliikangiella coralliicola]|uniref:Sodium:proton antiporter n=1 Tax=Aliikangiella coralliicola TaxID=2592383 RepID=A0A545UC53_9GAMM|nr:sodium:proton antiporter [Aliikangiella coralliicola]TQV87042.1 sodium:proton antiporter [Aliikangiella coralliicola]
MSLIDIITTILIFCSLGLVGLLICRRVPIPYSLTLVILGFGVSFLTEPLSWDTGIRASNFQDLMLYGLLPILIFEAAFGINSSLLRKYLPNTLTLATLGLMISSLITAVVLFYGVGHSGFPFIAALLTGVVVSATDPVAVVNQLKALKAPEELNVLIEGESLFNDATAIVLFVILLNVALGTTEPSVGAAIIRFGIVFFGGVLVGALLGFITAKISRWIEQATSHFIFITLLLAYGSFYISEHLLHVSGIVAIMFAAISFKHFSTNISYNQHRELHDVWHSLGFIANVFVFVLLGLVITLNMFSERWLAMVLAIGATLVARIIAVYFSNVLNHFTIGESVDSRYAPIMVWGGLRGAVTIALVLSLPTDLPYWWTIQSIGFGVVLFTLVVQATTNPWLMKRLGI